MDGLSRVVEPTDDGLPHQWHPALQIMDKPECKRWLAFGLVNTGVIGWWPAKEYHILVVITENSWGMLLQMAFPRDICPPFTEGNKYIDLPVPGQRKHDVDDFLKRKGDNYSDLAYGFWRMYVLEHCLDPLSPCSLPECRKYNLQAAADRMHTWRTELNKQPNVKESELPPLP